MIIEDYFNQYWDLVKLREFPTFFVDLKNDELLFDAISQNFQNLLQKSTKRFDKKFLIF